MEYFIRVLLGGKKAPEQIVLVNAEDAHFLGTHRCYPHTSRNTVYVRCYTPIEEGKPRKRIGLHALIMQPPPGMLPDHINGNALDNRRSNLRLVDPNGNAQNRKKTHYGPGKLATSQYIGVSRRADSGMYQAHVRVNGKAMHLGQFANEEDAAKARDDAVRRYGLLGKLNFPKRKPTPPAPAATPLPPDEQERNGGEYGNG